MLRLQNIYIIFYTQVKAYDTWQSLKTVVIYEKQQ